MEALDEASEAILDELVSKVGVVEQTALVRHMIEHDGTINDHIASNIAGQLGLSPEEVRDRANAVIAGFAEQARQAMGGTGFDEIVQHAKATNPSALRDAMREQATKGTTKGYAALATQYYASLADTPRGRQHIMEQPDAKVGKFFVTGGRLYVTHPTLGPVEWRTAVRMNLISPKHV